MMTAFFSMPLQMITVKGVVDFCSKIILTFPSHQRSAPAGNRTRVTRMGILYDTTTLLVLDKIQRNVIFHTIYRVLFTSERIEKIFDGMKTALLFALTLQMVTVKGVVDFCGKIVFIFTFTSSIAMESSKTLSCCLFIEHKEPFGRKSHT